MKKTSKKILTVILCAMLTSASLASCTVGEESEKSPSVQGTQGQQSVQTEVSGDSQNAEKPSSPNTDSSSNTSHDIQTDTYKEQISYYMSLTESLQADLIKLKEENYIDVCEYQMQIKTLEQTIQDLKDTIVSMTESINPPSSGGIQTPSNDNLSVKTEYKYTASNGEVTITEYTGSGLDIAIPSHINGNPVTCIGEEAFKGKQIRSVIIPSGIKKIDWFAFSGCTALESITIPSSVMSVGYGAFDYCPKALTVKCSKGSYIEAYAKSWGIKVLTE